jgi:hypothetical protein
MLQRVCRLQSGQSSSAAATGLLRLEGATIVRCLHFERLGCVFELARLPLQFVLHPLQKLRVLLVLPLLQLYLHQLASFWKQRLVVAVAKHKLG